MAKIVAVCCLKGGVGKTTTVASLGGLLSRSKKVLLIDLDPSSNLTIQFTDGGYEDTIYQAFIRRKELPIVSIHEGLDLVPSCADACAIETEFLVGPNSFGKDFILKELISQVSSKYDWIFIDCPPHIGVALANALVAAQSMLIPMSCDAFSAKGVADVINLANLIRPLNSDLKVAGVFLTRFSERKLVHKRTVEELNTLGGLALKTKIRQNADIEQAPFFKKDVWSYKKTSNGAQDYEALLNEIKKKV